MDWVTCTQAPACTGLAYRPSGLCLYHQSPAQRAEILRTFAPGRLVDLRGTTLDDDLLTQVLAATGSRPGRTRLDRARFTADARFGGVSFLGDVSLDGARFDRLASFFGARFEGNVSLAGAVFARELSFHGVGVRGHASLDRAVLARDALFSQAAFGRGLSCERARFDGYTVFDDARLGETTSFRGARFGRTLSFRKVSGGAGFDTAHFAGNAYLSMTGRLSASRVRADAGLDVCVTGSGADFRRAEIAGRLLLKLADSQADLEGAVLHGPASVTGRGQAALHSLRDVRAPELSLAGLDLSCCRFAGFAHPSGLRLKDCTFGLTPRGVRVGLHWPPLRWFTRRRWLADEHGLHEHAPDGGPQSAAGQADAERLAALYAELHRCMDDRNTASDFAFGAMEMRRMATRRWWLSLSWLLWGYGLRMGRTVVWFTLLAAIAMGAVFVATASHATRRSSPPPAPRPPESVQFR
ncbi:pentapeptide repeat-containing protein [Nonomuraea longicatena]|uniref:Pentapeptide repeat-containing protein n=1 Tax=Nonomuraea longicatena TaxID=83682 RepID=A0ABN1QL90_9ACTN